MKKFIYLVIFPILLSSCKAIEKKSTETKTSIEITFSCGEKNNLEQYINEGWKITKENGKTTLRLQVPYNYYELDDFKLKAIDLLGIKRNWLIDISLDNSRCTTLLSKKR